MINNEYDYLALINLAARTAINISDQGIFSYVSKDEVLLLQEEATKLNIAYDDTLSRNEFLPNFPENNIKVYRNFDRFKSFFPQKLLTNNYYGYHCCYDSKYKRLRVMHITEDSCISYYFVEKNEIDNNIIFSMSNVFYWTQIYKLLQKLAESVSIDQTLTIRSISKGERYIKYTEYDTQFDEENLREKYIRLEQIIQKTTVYPMLLKNRIVENIENINISMTELILELDCICDKTRNDYEIATYKIDFESYIRTYDTEISSFFDKTRTIIDKLLTNIFSIPLLYAGALFTFDKVDTPKNKIFIFIAVTIYTILSITLMIYHIVDTFSIEKKFDTKINLFTNGSKILKENTASDIKNMRSRLWFIRILNIVLILAFISLLICLFYFFRDSSNVT